MTRRAKPKPWRIISNFEYGWFYPDGCPVPLPADVRRVLRAVDKWAAFDVLSSSDCPLCISVVESYKAYQRAEQRRKGGAK